MLNWSESNVTHKQTTKQEDQALIEIDSQVTKCDMVKNMIVFSNWLNQNSSIKCVQSNVFSQVGSIKLWLFNEFSESWFKVWAGFAFIIHLAVFHSHKF